MDPAKDKTKNLTEFYVGTYRSRERKMIQS